MNWQSYSAMCISKGIENPYENEAHYNRAYGITESEEPLVIRSKHKSSIMDHCKVVNAIRETRKKKKVETKKHEAEVPQQKKIKEPKEPKPRYRPQKRYTDEEIKARRAQRRKEKREALKAQGLTIRGTPRVIREKKIISDEEIRARRLRYAKNYRTKHREKYLAYKKEYRERQKEADRKYREENIEMVREKQRRWAAAYRAKNREKFLAYQKEYRERKRTQSSVESGYAA